ncbi:MAG TPA: hypothetical protein VES67_26585 [Vicinamibacterales bacterium]|nr:hypothetical protein [Vicinamibacterales bacterium]
MSRRLIVSLAVVVALAGSVSAGDVRRHDPKMDQADDHLEKARVLIGATECGLPGDKRTAECEKHLKKVLHNIEAARDAVAAAMVAADGGMR